MQKFNSEINIKNKYINFDIQNKIEQGKDDEEEVYRITPIIGRYYETAEYTRKTGKYLLNTEQYFTKKDNIKYVGKLIQHEHSGFGDNAEHWEVFENDEGFITKIEYTYEGTTCFREVESIQDIFKFKRESLDIYDEDEFCFKPPHPPSSEKYSTPPSSPYESYTPPISLLKRQDTMQILDSKLEDMDTYITTNI